MCLICLRFLLLNARSKHISVVAGAQSSQIPKVALRRTFFYFAKYCRVVISFYSDESGDSKSTVPEKISCKCQCYL